MASSAAAPSASRVERAHFGAVSWDRDTILTPPYAGRGYRKVNGRRRIRSSPAARGSVPLSDLHQDGVDHRRLAPGELAELAHHTQNGVDLEPAATLQILQHRSLVRADGAGHVDARLDLQVETHAERFADCAGFDHHGADDGAGAGVGRDFVQQPAGQRAHRVEGQIAPELHPDLVADGVGVGRLEAGPLQRFDQACEAGAVVAVGLAEGEAVAAANMAHGARLDHLGSGKDHAADRALGPDLPPLHAAGVDGVETMPLPPPGQAVKIPPRDAVRSRDYRGIGAEQRRHRRRRGRQIMGLEGNEDEVLRPGGGGIVGAGRPGQTILAVDAQAQPAGPHGRQMRTAGDQRHLGPRERQPPTDIAADGAGAEDTNLHRRAGRSTGVGWSMRESTAAGQACQRSGPPVRPTPPIRRSTLLTIRCS